MKFSTIIFLGLWLATSISKSYGQSSSPLYQYLSMSPLIDRDPIFKDLHQNIQKNKENMKDGFNTNIYNKKFEKLKYQIINKLEASIEYRGKEKDLSKDSIIIVLFPKVNNLPIKDTIVIKADTLATIESQIDHFVIEFAGRIKKFLDKELNIGTKKEISINKILLNSLYTNLLDPENSTFIPYYKTEIEYILVISEFLKKKIAGFIKQKASNIYDIDLGDEFANFKDPKKLKEIIESINASLQMYLESTRNSLLIMVDSLERKVEELKKDLNRTLVMANAGLSVTSTDGDLGGGLYVAYKSKDFSLGIYTNGSGKLAEEESDTLSKQPFLSGFSFKSVIKKKVQLDILGSISFLDADSISREIAFEAGVGVSFKPNPDLIVGAAFFYQWLEISSDKQSMDMDSEVRDVLSIGVYLKPTQPNAPVIMVGVTRKTNHDKGVIPTIQISYPLSFK